MLDTMNGSVSARTASSERLIPWDLFVKQRPVVSIEIRGSRCHIMVPMMAEIDTPRRKTVAAPSRLHDHYGNALKPNTSPQVCILTLYNVRLSTHPDQLERDVIKPPSPPHAQRLHATVIIIPHPDT
jgi:hypothetical protein